MSYCDQKGIMIPEKRASGGSDEAVHRNDVIRHNNDLMTLAALCC